MWNVWPLLEEEGLLVFDDTSQFPILKKLIRGFCRNHRAEWVHCDEKGAGNVVLRKVKVSFREVLVIPGNDLVFPKKKLIFLHLGRNGGKSCERAIWGKTFGNPHRTSLLLKERLPAYPDFFSFVIVRNPWDRLVSIYHYYVQGGNKSQPDRAIGGVLQRLTFEGFVQAIEDPSWPHQDEIGQHLRPQGDYCTTDGKPMVSFVARFEKLQESFDYVCDKVGMERRTLPHINRSDHKPYQEYYSAQLKEKVSQLYQEDIEVFGYFFEEREGGRNY